MTAAARANGGEEDLRTSVVAGGNLSPVTKSGEHIRDPTAGPVKSCQPSHQYFARGAAYGAKLQASRGTGQCANRWRSGAYGQAAVAVAFGDVQRMSGLHQPDEDHRPTGKGCGRGTGIRRRWRFRAILARSRASSALRDSDSGKGSPQANRQGPVVGQYGPPTFRSGGHVPPEGLCSSQRHRPETTR